MVDSNDTMKRLMQFISGDYISSVEDLCRVCRSIRESREQDKDLLVKLANDYYLIGPRSETIDAFYSQMKSGPLPPPNLR